MIKIDSLDKLLGQTVHHLIIDLILPVLHHAEFQVDDLRDPIEKQVCIVVKTHVQIVIDFNFIQVLDAIFDFIKLIT